MPENQPMSAENDVPLEPGEAYYTRWGWSGCDGSAWRNLPSATKDGWRHAEEAQARANALAAKIDRCTEHLRVALGYAEGERDAGLESLAVQVKHARIIPPAASCSHCPPGCASCEPVDCECYAHQDEPDRRFIPPAEETPNA